MAESFAPWAFYMDHSQQPFTNNEFYKKQQHQAVKKIKNSKKKRHSTKEKSVKNALKPRLWGTEANDEILTDAFQGTEIREGCSYFQHLL